MQHLLDEAPGSRIWFHQQQNMHAKSKERSESEISTSAMSSQMYNFLLIKAREYWAISELQHIRYKISGYNLSYLEMLSRTFVYDASIM